MLCGKLATYGTTDLELTTKCIDDIGLIFQIQQLGVCHACVPTCKRVLGSTSICLKKESRGNS